MASFRNHGSHFEKAKTAFEEGAADDEPADDSAQHDEAHFNGGDSGNGKMEMEIRKNEIAWQLWAFEGRKVMHEFLLELNSFLYCKFYMTAMLVYVGQTHAAILQFVY